MADFKRQTLAEQILEGKADTGAKTSNDSLEARLDRDFADAWRPDPGDKIVGHVVELRAHENQYGTYPIVTLVTDDDEEVAVHAFHTTLRNGLKRARVEIGDHIAIKYLGKRTPQSGRQQYADYRVLREQKSGEDFWAQIEEEEQPPF